MFIFEVIARLMMTIKAGAMQTIWTISCYFSNNLGGARKWYLKVAKKWRISSLASIFMGGLPGIFIGLWEAFSL